MVDGFHCLWHYAVICSNNKNYNICNLCTAGTHHCECFVTWSIKECDVLSVFCAYLVSTNLLSNSTGFACRNIFITDSIQSLCLTVVNMSHDCNNRWTRSFTIRRTFVTCDDSFIIKTYKVNLTVVFVCKKCSCIRVNGLVDCYHHTHSHKLTDDFTCFEIHLLCKIGNGNCFHDINCLWNYACWCNFMFLVSIKFIFVKEFFLVLAVVYLFFSLKLLFSRCSVWSRNCRRCAKTRATSTKSWT